MPNIHELDSYLPGDVVLIKRTGYPTINERLDNLNPPRIIEIQDMHRNPGQFVYSFQGMDFFLNEYWIERLSNKKPQYTKRPKGPPVTRFDLLDVDGEN